MNPSRRRLKAVVALVFDKPGVRLIEDRSTDRFHLLISWRLGTDPGRPTKRSKTIHLSFPLEALKAYAAASSQQRHLADTRLLQHLRERLVTHDSDHQAPLGREAPVVRWSIRAHVLVDE